MAKRGRPPRMSIEERKEFGEFVRNHRKSLGWTQTKLAHWTGYSLKMIGDIERGTKTPEDMIGFEILLRDTVKEEMRKRRGVA